MKRLLIILSAIFLLLPISAVYADITTGLVSHYKMNDNAANTNVDDNIGGYDGVADTWTSLMTAAGQINTALSFNGTSDRILITTTAHDLLGPFTLACWIYPTQVGAAWFPMIDRAGVYSLRSDEGDQSYSAVKFRDTVSGAGAQTNASVLTNNIWHHIVAVFSGTTGATISSANMHIYVDNVDQTASWNGAWSATGGVNPTSLGHGLVMPEELAGRLDDVRIYNRALSVDDVAELYALGAGTEADSGAKTFKQYGTKQILPKTGAFFVVSDCTDPIYRMGDVCQTSTYGVVPTNTRFIDNGDGTITDKATGLEWVKQPERMIPWGYSGQFRPDNQIMVALGNYVDTTWYPAGCLVCDSATGLFYVCISFHQANGATVAIDLVNNPGTWVETIWTNSATDLNTPAQMQWWDVAWYPACENCHNLIYAGHDDWRLPNILELKTLADFAVYSPATYQVYFPNTIGTGVPGNWYWSSTSTGMDNTVVWCLSFDTTARVTGLSKLDANLNYVRPVRGGRLNIPH